MRTTVERALVGVAWCSGIGVPLLVAGLLLFLVRRGAAALVAALGDGTLADWLGPPVAGTLLLVAGSCALAIPVGVLAGVHLAEAPAGRARDVVRVAVEGLASVPSILMGLLGFGVLLLLRRTVFPDARPSLLLATVCISVLVLPYVVVATAGALDGLPARHRVGGAALGLSHWQVVRHVLLPSASRGILGGCVLAVGRAAEDTAVILLTGVVANAGIPRGPTDRFEALPFQIFYEAAEHRTPADLDRAFAAAVVLLLLVGTVFCCAAALHRGYLRRAEGQT